MNSRSSKPPSGAITCGLRSLSIGPGLIPTILVPAEINYLHDLTGWFQLGVLQPPRSLVQKAQPKKSYSWSNTIPSILISSPPLQQLAFQILPFNQHKDLRGLCRSYA
jgi:hypothetical protein